MYRRGDRVQLTQKGRAEFGTTVRPGHKTPVESTTGTVTANQFKPNLIKVLRDHLKYPDYWHVTFWEPIPAPVEGGTGTPT